MRKLLLLLLGSSLALFAQQPIVDTTTMGNWKGIYGGDGTRIANETANLPGYAQLSLVGTTSHTWGRPFDDPRALQPVSNSPLVPRWASTWYSWDSFTLDVKLTDGNTHQVAMYAVDYDNTGRVQLLELLDGSGNVLNSQTMSGFSLGKYWVWSLSGNFKIRITKIAGPNAVASAIFIGSPLPSNMPPALSVSTAALNFAASLGSATTSSTQAVNISNAGGGSLSWTATKAADWLNVAPLSGTAPSALSVSVNPSGLPAGSYTDNITVTGASESKTIAVTLNINASSSAVFVNRDTTKQGAWKNTYGSEGYAFIGETPSIPSYAQFSVNGAIPWTWADNINEVRALQKASGNARIASVWYHPTAFTMDLDLVDGATHQFALYATDYDGAGRAEKIEILDAISGNLLDTQTLSGFSFGQYLIWNISGHVTLRVTKISGPNAIVSGVFFGPPSTGGPPQQPVLTLSSSTLGFAASVGGSNPSAQNVTIANTGSGSLNWTASKSASWLSLSASSGAAPTELAVNISAAGLSPGAYSDTITISASGATGSPKTVTVSLIVSAITSEGGSAQFVGANFFGQGNWLGNFGGEGYSIVGQSPSIPSYVQMSVTGASTYTWFSSTDLPRALQTINGSGRIASCWYSATSFLFDLNFTGGLHRFTLYATDFDGLNRGERIEVLDAASGNVLDTQVLSSFQQGRYFTWNVAGHIRVRVTNIASPNAVVSGVFFDALPAPSLNISSNNISFTGIAGGTNPAAKSVEITNPAGSALNWTAVESAPWLSLSATSGSAPAILNLNASLAGLAAGSYTTQVTISAPGFAGSPKTVDVSLTVTEPQVISMAPIAMWTFDPATISGNTVQDTTPNQLHGTILGSQGAVSFQTAASGSQVAVFNGTNGYITTRTDPREGLQNDVTLAAWIRTTNTTRTETIVAKYNLSGSEDGYMFETTPSGYLAMHLGGTNVPGQPRDYVDGTNKINDGQWHHVVAILRPSQDLQFYVDGGLSSIFYLTIGGGANNATFSIGGPVLIGQEFFTGEMDDVRVYGRALSTKEIMDFWGQPVTTSSAGELLYNGIHLAKNFPPRTTATQEFRTPYYINNPPRVIPIDLGRQLFVDDFLIESTTALQRVPHQAVQRSSPVLAPGVPISAGAWWNPSGNKYEMWYWDKLAPVPDSYRYAYSQDGLNWIKPTFPDVFGPGTNAVIRRGDTIWLDLEEPNPARRYKSFGVAPGTGNSLGKIFVYFSPDGIRWTDAQDFGIVSISDRTTVFYNAFRKIWINSDRGAVGLPATDKVAALSGRARFYSESKDLLNWSPSNPADTFWTGADEDDPPYAGPGGEPAELYNLDGVAYESVMVGLFSWFHPGIGYRDHTRPGPILVEVGVGFSRDGFSWSRPNRGTGPNGAFIPASNMAGTWNAFNTQSVGGGFLVVGDELWFYYSARTLQKPLDGDFSTGLATLRRDGFFSMDAGETNGTLTTRPVKFSGNRLFLNVKAPNGALAAEVLDENGNVIPGFEGGNCTFFVGADRTSYEMSWNGMNLGSLAGRPVKFRFTFANASLYSFWVTSSPVGASNGYVAAGGPGFTTLIDTTGK